MGVVDSQAPSGSYGYEWTKRGLDLVAAGALFVAIAPLFALIALTLLIVEGRPILFGHRRVGRGGRVFRCLKFRTMVGDAETLLAADPELRGKHRGHGYRLPTRDDPRVTAIGRLLRRTYLDELPQLINVLTGEMSLVGPRPVVEEELAEFGSGASDLLRVRPGIFGPWNVLGHDRPSYPERAHLEVAYARAPTFAKDVLILIRAVRSVAQGEPDE